MFSISKSILTIFLSAAVLVGAAADSTLSALQKENAALREKLLKQGRELANMRKWLAGMVSGEALLNKESADIRLLRLNNLSKSSMALALKSDAVSKELRSYLRSAAIDEALRIKYIIHLDELDAAARNVFSNIQTPKSNQLDLRVIAVDNKLQIAVISGGMSSGVFPGMFLHPVNDPQSRLQLRVISVRPGACAADMVRGTWQDIVPGMALTPFRKR